VNIQDAIDVIESVAGFTDESTPVGEAWLEVLSFIHRPTTLAQPEPEGVTDEGIPQWSEGVCGDGAAILRDGVMMPIEEVVASLNRAEILTRFTRPTIEPVPVAERPWEREKGWRDPDGECWWCPPDGPPYWQMANPAMVCGGWLLPPHALPIPAPKGCETGTHPV
jgi:hypothetical protein